MKIYQLSEYIRTPHWVKKRKGKDIWRFYNDIDNDDEPLFEVEHPEFDLVLFDQYVRLWQQGFVTGYRVANEEIFEGESND